MQYLCKNRGNLANHIPFIICLSKGCIVNASCTIKCFVRYIKNVIHLGLQKTTFWGKTYGNMAKNRGKLENLFFLYDFSLSTNVKECSMYSTMPCMTYQTFWSK